MTEKTIRFRLDLGPQPVIEHLVDGDWEALGLLCESDDPRERATDLLARRGFYIEEWDPASSAGEVLLTGWSRTGA